MKKFTTFLKSNQFIYILGIFLIFIIWEIISISNGYGNLVFPSIKDTFIKLFEILSKKEIYISILWTILRTLIGFISAFILAILLGVLSGNFPKFRIFLKPLITVLKSAPTAAFVFLFLILSGSKYAPIYIVFLLSFPILYESVVGGIINISDDLIDAVKIDGASFTRSFIKVKLPLAMPYIIVGITSSFALSFKTCIMAEIISGDTNYGLGSLITSYRNSDPANLTPIFSITFIAIVIILIIDLFSNIINNRLKLKGMVK
ncbi:MAG: ABC transporter permease subunit [Gammaproteobacteria bacterium]|nr:ABC transporter permease subunit [Gammaproteobacteria bacterium]